MVRISYSYVFCFAMEYITKKLARQNANKPAASHMDADKLLKLFSAQNSRKARSFGERVTFVLNPTLRFWLRVVNRIMDMILITLLNDNMKLFLQRRPHGSFDAGTLLWFNHRRPPKTLTNQTCGFQQYMMDYFASNKYPQAP